MRQTPSITARFISPTQISLFVICCAHALNSEPGRDQLEILNLEQLPPEFFLLKIFSLLSRLGKITVSTYPQCTVRRGICLPVTDRFVSSPG